MVAELRRRQRVVVVVDPVSSGAPFVKEARERGFTVFCVYTTPIRGGEHGDLEIATGSAAEVIRAANAASLEIAGVLPASEPGVELAEELATHWGVRTNSCHTSRARRDKLEMRRAISRAGLRNLRFRCCSTQTDVIDAVAELGCPVMVKTPKSAGTNHVFRCDTLKGALAAYETVTEKSDIFGFVPPYAVVEEAVVGPEYAVNVFAVSGRCRLVDVWIYDKVDTPFATNLYVNMVQIPSCEIPEGLVEYAFAVAHATGLQIGPGHIECRMTPQGPVLMEIGSRLPGAGMPQLWERFSSFSPYRATLAAYTEGRDDFREFECPWRLATAFVLNKGLGKVKGFSGLGAIARLPSYAGHFLRPKIGDTVGPAVDLSVIPLQVYLANRDPQQLRRDINQCHELFDIEV